MANDREHATLALIASLKNRFPEKGFFITESIKFVHENGKGLCAIAKKKIPKDQNIIVVNARLGASSMDSNSDFDLTETLRAKIIQNESRLVNMAKEIPRSFVAPGDYLLAVAMMKILSKKSRNVSCGASDDTAISQAATWPHEEDMKDSSWFYWDLSKVKTVWNQSGLTLFLEQSNYTVRSNFDKAIFPVLAAYSDDYIDSTLPSNVALNKSDALFKKQALWNTFIYALSLAWSRAHGDGECPELIPVIELINGQSELVDQTTKRGKTVDKTTINIDIAFGKWPFLSGGIYRDDCNLPCTAVYANRDIDEGEELIISYGELSPFEFMIKYGSVPEELISHHDILSHVCLWCDPEFIPDDTMRIKCLEKSGYPLEEFRHNKKCTLVDLKKSDFEAYKRGCEPDSVMSVRQYLILAAIADDFELNRNFTTGRLRGPLYQSQVLPLICQIIDYNLVLLSGNATSADDVTKASDPNTPAWEKTCLLARVVYRESLIIWRRAIAKEAVVSGSDADLTVALSGCDFCGRTYPSMKCGRCKKAQYCSRGHQAISWKNHKNQCS